MRSSALLSAAAALSLAGAAEAAPKRPAKGEMMGPGYVAPGLGVRVHRGRGGERGEHRAAARPAPRTVVIVVRERGPYAYPGFARGYPPRDWSSERFGQADWSGDRFGGEDFAFGPWAD